MQEDVLIIIIYVFCTVRFLVIVIICKICHLKSSNGKTLVLVGDSDLVGEAVTW